MSGDSGPPGSGQELDVAALLGALAVSTPQSRPLVRDRLASGLTTEEPVQLSVRAQRVTNLGEWDDANDLCLVRIEESDVDRLCLSSVGNLGCFCLQRSLAPGGSCVTTSHKSGTVEPGWFIAAGGGNTPKAPKKAYRQPRLPLYDPLEAPGVRSALLDPDKPFMLSLGQWKYAFAEIDLYCRGLGRGEDLAATTSEDSGVLVDNELEDLEARLTRFRASSTASAGPTPASGSTPRELSQPTPQASGQRQGRGTNPPPSLSDEVVELIEAQVERILGISPTQLETLADQRRELDDYRLRQAELRGDVEQLKSVMARQRSLMDGLLDAMNNLNIASTSAVGGPSTDRLRQLERGAASAINRIERLERTCYDPTGLLATVREDIKDLENKVDLGGVQFEDFKWSSPREFLDWMRLKTGATPPSFGLFVDTFTLLHNLTPGTVRMSDALGAEHATQKVNYNTDMEARSATSFVTEYPDVFGKSESGDKFGKSLTSYSIWKAALDRTGLFFKIKEAVKEDGTAVMSAITAEIGDIDVRTLARSMLTTTQIWIHSFCAFVDEFYAEMSSAPSMSEAESWTLTKSLMGEILSSIRVARSVVREQRQTNRLMHIWGALKAHEAMRQYLDKEFRDHAGLSGLQMRFLMKRKTDIDGMERVSAKLTLLENKLSAFGQKVDTVSKEVKKKADK